MNFECLICFNFCFYGVVSMVMRFGDNDRRREKYYIR